MRRMLFPAAQDFPHAAFSAPRKSSHAPLFLRAVRSVGFSHTTQKFLHYTRSPSCRKGFPPSPEVAFSDTVSLYFYTHSQLFAPAPPCFSAPHIPCKFLPRRSSPSITSLVRFPRAAALRRRPRECPHAAASAPCALFCTLVYAQLSRNTRSAPPQPMRLCKHPHCAAPSAALCAASRRAARAPATHDRSLSFSVAAAVISAIFYQSRLKKFLLQ